MSLQRERVTAVESQLYTFMQDSEKREDALKKYIHDLESDLDEAKKALTLSQEQATDIVELEGQVEELHGVIKESAAQCEELIAEKESQETANGTLRQQMDTLEKKQALYRLVTGMEVVSSSGDENSFDCCVVNSETSVTTKFRLTSLNDGHMMKFEPTENTQPLPSFLHNAIEFERTQCPALLQNVLKGVFPE